MTYASRRSGGSLWHWAVFAVVAFLVTTPVISLVFGSFSSARLPNDFDIHKLTLNNYATVWLDPRTYKVFLNTFTYVAGATTIGIVVATTFAWLCERTNISGKIWIYAGVPLTLAMPGMLPIKERNCSSLWRSAFSMRTRSPMSANEATNSEPSRVSARPTTRRIG